MSLAPTRDPKPLLLRIVVLVAAGVVLIFGARYFLTRPATYEGNGVAFDYPSAWEEVTGEFTPPAGIDLLWTQGLALDDENGAGVAGANMGTVVPGAFFETAARQELEPVIRTAVEGAGGTLSGPVESEVAGQSALTYEIAGLALGTSGADVSLTLFADGAIVYFIACQATPGMEDEVEAGCQTIRESFEIR